jgi:polyvinyl alcohol dehydrogenase (cytochrome)
MIFRLLPWCIATLMIAAPAALRAQDGAALFQAHCALCHDADAGAADAGAAGRVPSREVLKQLSPDQIVTALEKGAMRAQGADRSRAERYALAEFLSGKPYTSNANAIPRSAFCQGPEDSVADAANGPSWNGWGVSSQNTRFQPAAAAGLSPEDLPKLHLKWAFGFPGATSASAQPAVFAGRVYVGSWEGDVYSLDAKTGCIRWTIETEAGIRSAVSIGKDPSGRFVAYFADLAANVYAVDAATGKPIWKVKIDDYPFARVTGSPVLHQGRLYVPLSAREESQVANLKYVCCKFRGSVAALDAASGKLIWKTLMIDQEPQPTQKNPAGTQMWGPAGAAVWSAPTIDVERNALYVGTGNSYSFPPVGTTDAIIALDLDSGKIRWVRQMTDLDVWNGGCSAGGPQVCSKDAPDFDFGASPILVKGEDGKRVLLAGNKSAMLYAMDPDQDGKLMWQQKLGRGGTSGGILWGPAVDDRTIYAALTDQVPIGRGREVDPNVGGGIVAVPIAGGDKRWSTPNPPCGDRKPCSPTQAAAVTAIPGVVFSGSNDGHMRAYSTQDGKILWEYDTVREFTTVNGIKAKGGSINNGGPAVAGGMVFTNAGYSHHSGVIPGNVLLAFSAE